MENKLTDETVNSTVKSLKWVCNQIPKDLGDSNEERMLKCIQLYCQQGIAVIERLQSDKSHWEERWKEQVEETDELKAKIEQGTLIELPCKVGDTIYVPWSYDGVYGISFHEISAIEINKGGIYLVFYIDTDVYYLWMNTYNQGRFNLSWLGIKFFLTREEAEKRLKELQNESN